MVNVQLHLDEPAADAHPWFAFAGGHQPWTWQTRPVELAAHKMDGGKPTRRHVRPVEPDDIASRAVEDEQVEVRGTAKILGSAAVDAVAAEQHLGQLGCRSCPEPTQPATSVVHMATIDLLPNGFFPLVGTMRR